MAARSRSVAENVPGDLFVDETCIDCDTCRQLAPEVFSESGEYSFVRRIAAEREQSAFSVN